MMMMMMMIYLCYDSLKSSYMFDVLIGLCEPAVFDCATDWGPGWGCGKMVGGALYANHSSWPKTSVRRRTEYRHMYQCGFPFVRERWMDSVTEFSMPSLGPNTLITQLSYNTPRLPLLITLSWWCSGSASDSWSTGSTPSRDVIKSTRSTQPPIPPG